MLLQKRYQQIVEAAGYVVCITDHQGVITHISDSIEALIGYAPKDVVDRPFKMFIRPDWVEAFERVFELQQTTIEIPVVAGDGQVRWIEQCVQRVERDCDVMFEFVMHDITARRKAAHEAQVYNELYRVLVRYLPDTAVMLFDHDLRYMIAEGAALNRQGFSKEMMEGRTLFDVVNPEGSIQFEPFYRRALAGEKVVIENTYSGRDYYTHFLPVHDLDGSVFAGMVVIRDVTEQKRTETALRENELRFRGLFEHNNDAVFFIDTEGVIRDANHQAAVMLGYPVEELVGMHAYRNTLNDGGPDRDSIWQALMAGETLPLYERTFRRKDGSTFPAELNVALARDADGQPSHVQSIVRDITERKANQAQMTRRVDQLTTLLDVDAELVDRLDVDYVLTMGLDSAMRLSGADAGFIALINGEGRLALEGVVGDYPVDQAEQTLTCPEGVVTRVIETLVAEMVTSGLRCDQRPETVAQIVAPMVSHDRVVGILNLESRREGMFNEEAFDMVKLVTTRMSIAVDNARLHRQTEQQLAELQVLYERVHTLEKIKTDMIRIASHDLNNPLTAIIGHAELMRMDLETFAIPGELPEYIDQIERSARRMRKITSDILSLERIEEAVQETLYQDFDIADLVRIIYDQNHSPVVLGERQFVLRIAEERIRVRGDAAQIGEAIVNLMSNAIKYTRRDGVIETRLWQTDNAVVFEVEDNGYGIPAQQQDRLFQPFYRAKTAATSDIEGTGLGLHLVKNIVDRHKGSLRFRSVYGEGSMFGFSLPLWRD